MNGEANPEITKIQAKGYSDEDAKISTTKPIPMHESRVEKNEDATLLKNSRSTINSTFILCQPYWLFAT